MAKVLKKRRERLEDKEWTAEEEMLNDLFYDFYRYRGRVYRINFFRGIFFGLGAFLGGTIIAALIVIILSWLMSIAPDNFHDFFQWIVNTLSKKSWYN